jgi:hypothetical protein
VLLAEFEHGQLARRYALVPEASRFGKNKDTWIVFLQEEKRKSAAKALKTRYLSFISEEKNWMRRLFVEQQNLVGSAKEKSRTNIRKASRYFGEMWR